MSAKFNSLKAFSSAIVALSLVSVGAVQATIFNGNGNTGFGGAIGTGSLTLTDDGTTLSGTVTRGSGTFNNSLVLYIDSVGGGFSDTSTLGDTGDGLRQSISGFSGGANRSTLTFASGFSPDYAIALGPQNASFGGLWQLAAGGSGSLSFISSVSLSPTGTDTAASYTFSLNLASLGLTPGAGQSFGLFGTYISDTGFRSTETVAGTATGTQGWQPFTQTAFGSHITTVVPEPTAAALLLLGSGLVWLRRKR